MQLCMLAAGPHANNSLTCLPGPALPCPAHVDRHEARAQLMYVGCRHGGHSLPPMHLSKLPLLALNGAMPTMWCQVKSPKPQLASWYGSSTQCQASETRPHGLSRQSRCKVTCSEDTSSLRVAAHAIDISMEARFMSLDNLHQRFATVFMWHADQGEQCRGEVAIRD